jgi:esterase/lipase
VATASHESDTPVKPPITTAVPLSLKLLRTVLKFGSTYAPEFTAQQVNHIWFTPKRHDEPHWIDKLLVSAEEEHQIYIDYDTVKVYSWGAGPNVLLVHGWSGRGVQLRSFIIPLVKKGYKVSLFDARAHGRSQGFRTDVVDFEILIRKIANAVGGIDSIIAHSLGGAASIRTVLDGLPVNKLVCIGTPASLDYLFENFSSYLQLPGNIEQKHKLMFEQKHGESIWMRYSLHQQVSQLMVEGLLIHDKMDPEVPIQCSQRLHRNWKKSRLLQTDGLANNTILDDPQVVDTAVNFICGKS